jgi:hypothetical protein
MSSLFNRADTEIHPHVYQAEIGSPDTERDTTTCGIVSEVGHAESWWGADRIGRILRKDWQPLMKHDSIETWHSHVQFRHLTQLPRPQTGYNKSMVTCEPHSKG